MALIYITGAPGVGKTTIQEALVASGYDARDIDDSELGGPVNVATGKRVVIPTADNRTRQWFGEHTWMVDVSAFEKLHRESRSADIVVCGVASTDHLIRDMFDAILYLNIDDDTLAARVKRRVGNDYGKNSYELNEILRRKKALDGMYKDSAVSVDATQPLSELVKDIKAYLG